jgi:hypothetical protein
MGATGAGTEPADPSTDRGDADPDTTVRESGRESLCGGRRKGNRV